MEIDPNQTRLTPKSLATDCMCEHIVGLPSVNVLGIEDGPGGRLVVHIECRGGRPFCTTCNGMVVVKERPVVDLGRIPAFGRPVHLLWRKPQQMPRPHERRADLPRGAPSARRRHL